MASSTRPATARTTREGAASHLRARHLASCSSDPRAITRFKEHEVVLPVVVVTELEAKRHHPELGYFARTALRMLDDLRIRHGRLDAPVPIGDEGGTLRVELNHTDPTSLPAGFRLATTTPASSPWPATSPTRAATSRSSARTCRCGSRRRRCGLEAEEYRAELAVESGWTGMAELDVTVEEMDHLYEYGRLESVEAAELPCHTGLVLSSPRGSALGRVGADKQVRLVRGDRDAFGLHGRSAEQRIALDLLLDPDIGIVTLGGRAGTGKSALALCAGLEAVMERRQQRKVVVFRPLYAVGGQELGYLPGDASEKMNPWGQAVFDTLGGAGLARGRRGDPRPRHARGAAADPHPRPLAARRVRHRRRGPDLERNVLLTVLSRIGQNSRVVLTHDVAQRDNLRVGRHDGVVAVDRGAQGPPAVRPRHAHPQRAQPDRGPGHRPARGHRGLGVRARRTRAGTQAAISRRRA